LVIEALYAKRYFDETTRRTFSPEFRASVAVADFNGVKTVAKFAKNLKLHPNQTIQSRQHAAGNMTGLSFFQREGIAKLSGPSDADFAKVGRLTQVDVFRRSAVRRDC
jgi:hypothetical protein